MRSNRKLAVLVSCLLVFSLIVAQGNNNRAQLGDTRNVTLPSYVVLDEHAQPLITSSGKVGFVSSVTAGSLLSFSVTSGKILSSLAVGETIGPISMIEISNRRLIAVPAMNEPSRGIAATVSIIDATSARQLNLQTLIVLPSNAQITPATRALLTRDGRFCVIASSFDEPTLYLFSVESGELLSSTALVGRASEVSLYESGGRRSLAVASAAANNLSLIKIDDQGQLILVANFSPTGARFGESNNPEFSADGGRVYIAASEGDRLFQVDAESGDQMGSISVSSPHRVTVAASKDGSDCIGVTRIGRPGSAKSGGVTVVSSNNGLSIKTEFTPPDDIEFSRANNVAFDSQASVAFVGSATGVLFAFSAETGELEAHQMIGSELRRVVLNEKGRTVVAVRSASKGDELVIINFDVVDSNEPDPLAPRIRSLNPDVVEQGRLKNLQLTVSGENFTEGASLVVNNAETAAELVRQGTALEARLPRSLFNQPGGISIQVKGANGQLSEPRVLKVVRPADPVIERIKPDEMPGPNVSFMLKVSGKNFRASSTIFVAGHPLNTERIGDNQLRAQVPAERTGALGQLAIQVRDVAVPDVASNEKSVFIYGPRITELNSSVDTIVAGAGGFKLRIKGVNFREGAQVEINGQVVPSGRVRRLSSEVIRVSVSSRFAQDAGRMAIVVRNREGGVSEPKHLDARAPDIQTFAPGRVLAGLTDLKVDIHGQNFRKHASVYVGDSTGKAFKIERKQVRFRSSSRIVVTLDGELNELLAQPGSLKFQVVNPNRADGVPSTDKALSVVGPEINGALIKPTGDDTHVRLTITGANFRKGAVVEFVKGDAIVRQQAPVNLSANRLSLVVPANKIEGLGDFQVRVVNPSIVRSNVSRPRQDQIVSNTGWIKIERQK